MTQQDTHSRFGPAIIALVVAVVGFVALLLVDLGPWNKPSAANVTMLEVGRSAGVAAAAGAVVTDTGGPSAQKPSLSTITDGPRQLMNSRLRSASSALRARARVQSSRCTVLLRLAIQPYHSGSA